MIDWPMMCLPQRSIAHKILPDEITLRIRPDEDMKLDGEPSHAQITIEVKYSVVLPATIILLSYTPYHMTHTQNNTPTILYLSTPQFNNNSRNSPSLCAHYCHPINVSAHSILAGQRPKQCGPLSLQLRELLQELQYHWQPKDPPEDASR